MLTATTSIDRLKGEESGKHSVWENLSEVFGGEAGFSWYWFLPTTVKYKDPEAIFGYRIREEAPLVGVVVAVDGVPISSDHSSSPTTNVELSDRSVRTPPPGAKTRGQYHSVGTFDENDDDGDVGDNGMPEFGP